jgi:hypothetical protein
MARAGCARERGRLMSNPSNQLAITEREEVARGTGRCSAR